MRASLISSLYRTDAYIQAWHRRTRKVLDQLNASNIEAEIVVVANDPTKKEMAVLEQLKEDSRFKVLIVGRESIYASWNRGLSESSGDICGFWNVDDVRFSKAIIDAAERFSKGASLVYFPFIYKRYVKAFGFSILAKIKIFKPPAYDSEIFRKEMHCGPFFMFKKDFFQKVGNFDESYKISGDYEWCTRAAKISAFEKSDTLGGIFTNDGTTLSGSKSKLQEEENARVISEQPKNNQIA